MSFWRSGKTDCLLIGTKGPQTMDYGILKERLASTSIAADLKRIDIHNAPEFLLHLVMGARGVENFSAPAVIHTDDNALVEFSAPRSLTRTVFQLPLLEGIEEHREADLEFLTVSEDDPVIAEELARVKQTAERFIAARGQVFWTYILQNRNQVQKASEALQKATALNPSDSMLKEFNAADHYRAFKLAKAGKMGQAISVYRTMVQRVPGDEKAHYNLALALKRIGNLNEALRHYKEAARLKPDYVIAVYNVGEVSQQLGDLDAAFSAYQKALKLKPDLIPALNSLSRLLAAGPDHSRRDPSEAVRLAEKANKLTDHRDPYLLETLGVAYEAAGRREDAASTVRQALSLARKAGYSRLVNRLMKKRSKL
jgi:tetratricopeptide (TPR) repeat protein